MMHPMLWFVLVGWTAGWVVGRAIKGSGFGAWGDVFLGVIGGVAGGWLMRHTGTHSNWGFAVSVGVAAACAALLTWFFRRIVQRQTWLLEHPKRTPATQHYHAHL